MEKKLRVFKGGRICEDIYEKCQKDGAIDIDGEVVGDSFPDPLFDAGWYQYGLDDDAELRWKASQMVRDITDDPLEHQIADLILDYGFTEKEVAIHLNISPARVEWLMRKIEAWRRSKQKRF